MDNQNNVKYLIDQVASKQAPVGVEGHHPFMLQHRDLNVIGLEEHAERPYRVKQHAKFTTPLAFIQYVNDFAGDCTRVFSDVMNEELGAIIDYHKPDGTPSHCDHNAQLILKRDVDLDSWIRRNGEVMSQQAFVRFLVDYASKVKDAFYKTGDKPVTISAAEFMELVSNIKSMNTTDIESGASVGGNVELKMAVSKNVKAGGKDIPERLSIALPVHRGGDEYYFDFRIMVNTCDGVTRFSFKLIRPEAVIEHAFKDVLTEVQTGLKDGLKIYGL